MDSSNEILFGEIASLNNENGYGFIRSDKIGSDDFVHLSDIKTKGVQIGDKFSYIIVVHEKRGRHAVNVRLEEN